MERRRALKNIGLGLGYAVATPSLISIIQSCKNKETIDWVPAFFSPEQGQMVKRLVDVILPKTDTPSASEVNVHVFIDEYIDKVMELEFQGFLKILTDKFADFATEMAGKDSVSDLSDEELENALSAALQSSKENKEAHQQAIGKFMEAQAKGEAAELDAEVASTNFADSLRDFAIQSYKLTEEIGENVLTYQSIPGEYVPCGDLEELTGGKAYSLD